MGFQENQKITRRTSGSFQPFKVLKQIFKKHPLPSGVEPDKKSARKQETRPHADFEMERQIFLEAVSDVKPLADRNRRIEKDMSQRNDPVDSTDFEDDALDRLRSLIICGKGFSIADTSEYMEGFGYPVFPEITRRLHKGDFPIQAHIDLHGLGIRQAECAFNQFMSESIRDGRHAVLIVHGRGRSSTGRPVLKRGVYQWLTNGYWRKWVIAFSSARACDGGAGATYVLLRERPYTRRDRKRSTKKIL